MPQELRIVKCFRCLTYQVDIVKKDKKWVCKMCGAKQTLKQEFGRGSGIECRKLVQKLNMKKHEFEQMAHDVVIKIINEEIEVPDFLLGQNSRPEDGIPLTDSCTQPKHSKWETFVEPPDDVSDSEGVLEQQQLPSNTKRVYKRKSYTPETIKPPEKLENSVPTQKTTFFNFNKKSKFELTEGNVLASDPKVNLKPIDKLNLYTSETAKPQEKLFENSLAPQKTTSTFFNFNKKSRFEFTEDNVLTQHSQSKPKSASNPEPKRIINSKWGNFLNNSEEEDE